MCLEHGRGVAKRRPIQHYDLRDRTTPTAEWPGVEETTTAVGLAGVPAAEEEGAAAEGSRDSFTEEGEWRRR